jgi:hypothetical protein
MSASAADVSVDPLNGQAGLSGCVRAGLQPSECDRDEPADGSLGRQAVGGFESVEAVRRELTRRDVIADVAGHCGVGKQAFDQVADMLLCSRDVFTSMQQRGELVAVDVVVKERVGLEHRRESFTRIVSMVSDLGEILEVTGDLPFVPGDEDRFDVGEVLVQSRTADARLLGDLRHRHRRQPVLGYERRHGVQGGVAHRAAMRLDGVVPEPGHSSSIRSDAIETDDLTAT